MKYQKVMYQFLKQCRQFDFLYFVDMVNALEENIVVNTIEVNTYSCHFYDPITQKISEVLIRLNDKKEIIYTECTCEQDEELFDDNNKYCPHIIGTYLLILESFNEDLDIIQYLLDQLDTIQWKEVVEDTFKHIAKNDELFPDLDNDDYSDISIYQLFDGMTRDEILEFLDNISVAFPPLKTMLVQATMLAEMIGGEEGDEFEEIDRLIKKKKGMLS